MAAESDADAAGQPAQGWAVAAAQARLARGDPTGCLALLAALPAAQHQDPCVRQLQAVCQVQLAGASGSQRWWEVLGLDPTCATAFDVRRQYKRLAALVHPDKCGLAAAKDAFQQLQAAADRLLQEVQHAEAGEGREGRRKRARAQGSSTAAQDGLWGDGVEDEGWFRDGGGFPWWGSWEPPPPAEPASAAEQAAGSTSAAPGGGRAGGAAGEGQQAQPPSRPGQGEREQLLAMPLHDLRAEVRRRQAALLEPQQDAEGRPMPLAQLQAALRQARSVLSDRVAAEAAERAAALGGGFLP